MNLRKPTRAFLLAAVIGAAAMGACSLNPQPIPPGEQAGDGGGSDFGTGGTDGSALNNPADSGPGSVPIPGEDGGDAATDAGDQDASDAATDANDE